MIICADVTLFDREMKYLYDNGFKVLTVNDLGYDTKNNFLYIKSSVAQKTLLPAAGNLRNFIASM